MYAPSEGSQADPVYAAVAKKERAAAARPAASPAAAPHSPPPLPPRNYAKKAADKDKEVGLPQRPSKAAKRFSSAHFPLPVCHLSVRGKAQWTEALTCRSVALVKSHVAYLSAASGKSGIKLGDVGGEQRQGGHWSGTLGISNGREKSWKIGIIRDVTDQESQKKVGEESQEESGKMASKSVKNPILT